MPPQEPRNDDSYFNVEDIRSLDPLHADTACRQMQTMNREADLNSLVEALRGLIPNAADLSTYRLPESIAAMRDLGMFIGSIKRHGAEPTTAVPELTPVLLELGRRTSMIPRDTVHHYTTWNPVGDRQRMYTGEPEEGVLQDAVRMVFPRLSAAVAVCDELADLEPQDSRFAPAVDALAQHLTSMVEAIDLVVKNVSPVFFARTLRPYFEEVTVAGKTYLGPAAAQVPLWLFDLVLWKSDCNEPEYETFMLESVPYSLPPWRTFFAARRSLPSAVTKLAIRLEQEGTGDVEPSLLASASALARALRVLITFRGRHLGIARQAYHEEIRLYEFGSGGAPIELLRQVLDLTRQNQTLVRHSMPRMRSQA
ncbi:MAG: monodechloroaminopyrrolnitrin synthase PrnB family protein [Egibacteraceae bacterium]